MDLLCQSQFSQCALSYAAVHVAALSPGAAAQVRVLPSTTLSVYSEHNSLWLKIVRIWLKYYNHLTLVTKRFNVLLRQYRAVLMVNLNNLLFSIVSNRVQNSF